MPLDLQQTCRALNESLPTLGSATCARRMVVVDCPRPWASKIDRSAGFPAGLNQALDACRPFHLAGRLPGQEGPAQATVYERRGGATWECSGPVDDLGWLQGPWEKARPALYVCTHGSRDVCCGRLGVPVLAAARSLGPACECSHLGGHRFAPTLLLMPEWRMFGRVTPDQVASVFAPGPSDHGMFRGVGYLSEPAQVVFGHAERALGERLVDAGVLEERADDSRVRLRLEVHTALGNLHRFAGTVRVERADLIVSCADVAEGRTKSTASYYLDYLEEEVEEED